MATDQQRRRITPKSAGEWGAVLPQWVGMFMLLLQLVVFLVFKIATGEDVSSAAFLTASGGLIVVGQGKEALNALKPAKPPEDEEEAK